MQLLATSIIARRRVRPGYLVATVLVASLVAHAAAAFDWQVEVTPAGELFPALDLSQAPRTAASASGTGDGLLSVRLGGRDLPARFEVRVDTPGLREPTRVEARASGHVVELHPRLDWDTAQLRALNGVRRQALRVTVLAEGVPAQTKMLDVRLHPLDDALYFVREGSARVDLGWAFAGYVDPHDPVVDDVLALARAADPDFDEPGDDRDAVLRRVAAVWAALEQRGLTYAPGNPALSRGPSVYSQRVRLLADVWRERRANCIDSSVLIASVLERLDIATVIVLVPGHAFIGFRAGPGELVHLETTLLGASTGAASADARFAAAVSAGRARWRAVAARVDGRHGPDYAVVDIAVARRYGIVPLTAERSATAAATPAAVPVDGAADGESGVAVPFD